MRFFIIISVTVLLAACGGSSSTSTPSSPSPTPAPTPTPVPAPPPPTLSFSGTSQLTITRFSTFYRTTGTVDVTLNIPISPPPSRVRAEFETSLVGGSTTDVSGRTQMHFDINQDTVACPRFPATGDFLRLIDVDRQVTLARTNWGHGGTLPTACN
jgi:hypothetical protein